MRFQVLGSIDVVRDGVPVGIGGPQQRRLLGVLLMARSHRVTTDRLVDALWPDGDAPDGAPRSVVTYVSRLRAAIGDGFVETHGSSYRLRLDGASFDVEDFEALVTEAELSLPDRAVDCYDRALALWSGEPFGEFTGEWWARPESTRLADRRTVAREERAGALIALGHHARAVPDLDGLVLEHPLRERPVSLLMQALAATGRQADALRAYRSFRARLAEETGLEPSAGLVAFEREVAGTCQPSGDGVGRPLRGYVIHDAIGEGSHGRVYAATQPGTERRVAIKAIRPDLADSSDFIRRFEAEARLVGRLEHPHIVPLYDYWREPGGAYLVFRYMAGGTARDAVISGGPWSLPRVSQLVEEVGGALIVAHAAGVVHHDVKTSNVLLDERGSAYLGDFGIAAHDPDDQGADERGVRDDVRDFGLMLWELLTADLLEPGWGGCSSVRNASGVAPSLVGRAGAVPQGLDAVLARATDPAGGYSTVAEVVLGWRAAVGRPDGVLSPVTSDERREVDSARRLAARRLAEATAAGVNPYLGLRAFDEADAAGFFGRLAAVDDLEVALGKHRLVTVVGASGSGKSSLVRAGLVPRLRAAGGTVITMVPGDDAVAAFRHAVTEVSARFRHARDLATLVSHVANDVGPLVVVVDQFEECWTRGEADRQAEFVVLMAGLVDGDDEIRFVTTIRADVLDRPLLDAHLGTHVGAGAFVLAPLTPAQLGDAISRPAARAGVIVDDAVVAELTTEACSQPGSLPLLQFTLAELYDRRVDARIGVDALLAVGGMAGSIGRRAEEVYESLDPRGQDDAHALFTRVVTPGDGAPDTRRRARLSELSSGARTVTVGFLEARLLVADRDAISREPTIEVAHEALLSRWPRLAAWIEADRQWLRQLHHLSAAAAAWDERGRLPSDLYRGSRLEAAIESLDAGRDVADSEREFVEAGRDARDREVRAARRTARRLRRSLVGVGVLLVVAIAAGTLAYVGQRRARDEERDAAHRALVSDSTALRSSDRDLAALLAVEAHRLDPSPATESALFGTFAAVPGLERTVHPGVDHEGGAVLLDNETMAVEDSAGGAHLLDISTGDVRYSLSMLDGGVDVFATWLAATPDGRYLAMAWRADADDRSVLNVYDLGTRRVRFSNVEVPYKTGTVAISPDGSLVAVGGSADARADVYDAATGELLVELEPIPRPEDAALRVNTVGLAFRSDAELIVTSQTGTIRIVEPTTGRELKRFEGERETAELRLLMSSDANSMVTLGARGVNRLDLVSGEALWPRPFDGDGRLCSVALVERLGVALCGQDDGVVRAIDLDTGDLDDTGITSLAGSICALMNSPDGSMLVATVCDSNEYMVWRLDGGGAISRALLTEDAASEVLRYTGDGRAILREAEPAPDNPVTQLVNVATRTAEPLAGIFGPVPTGDPSVVLALFENGRGTLSTGLYDLTTRSAVGSTFDPEFEPWGVREVDGSSYVWGQEQDRSATGEYVGRVAAVGPDGHVRFDIAATLTQFVSLAATDADHVVVVKCEPSTGCVLQRLDPKTGKSVGEPAVDEAGYFPIVATSGLLIAATGAGQIRVLDPETLLPVGAPLPRIRGGGAAALSLSDDGRRLLVLGEDGAFRVYDVPSRTQLGDPMTVSGSPLGAALRGDGLEAAVGTDHGIVVWDLDPEHWIDGACAVAGRNLTRAEWDQYIGDLATYRQTCPDHAPAE